MLDPGGEMEVSDVRLCCGRDEDKRGEKQKFRLGREKTVENAALVGL